MEDEESLKTSALLRKFADSVQDKVNNLLSNGVVTTSIVVGSILKTRNTSFYFRSKSVIYLQISGNNTLSHILFSLNQ